MPRYNDTVVNQAGHPLSGVSVTVTIGTTATLAPLFVDALYVTPLANPVTSDGLGRIGFYIVPGDYTLALVGGNPPIISQSYAISVGAESGGGQLQAFTGTQDGSNVVFTLNNTPTSPTSVQIYLNGLLQSASAGPDYTLVGKILTFTVPPAPTDNITVYF